MITLAIDPGIRSPGAAVFVDETLIAATRIKVPAAVHKQNLGDRVCIVARLINGWFQTLYPVGEIELVYEWPQIYRASRSKGDPNALLKTLAIGAAASALVRADRVFTPTPHDWARNTSKATSGDPWNSPRAKMVDRRLSAAERAHVPSSHDAIDAVAIGLWQIGRFEPLCVFPGASPG